MPEKADPMSALREALAALEAAEAADIDRRAELTTALDRAVTQGARRATITHLRAALSGEAPDRDGEIERIAAALHEAKVDCNPVARIGGPYGVSPEQHARASNHDVSAAALYDAGLRAHPEAGETT